MIRRLRKGEATLYKAIRLEALKDAPDAFASTYESALLRSEESWTEQADGTAEGGDRATFIAFGHAEPIGMAALYRDGSDSRSGELLQMWVSPHGRGKGTAADLLNAVFEWASSNEFAEVRAEVTRANRRAIRFYEKYGFQRRSDLDKGNTVTLIRRVKTDRGFRSPGDVPPEEFAQEDGASGESASRRE